MSFSPIACQDCRSKKRKCDRKIPTCSQCTRSTLTCTYPGTSKRGLPSGYIAKIEERLAQTEAALLQALSTIHGPEVRAVGDISPGAQSSETAERQQLEFNEIRIAKVEEWQTYRLESETQQKEWMRHKIDAGDLQDGVHATAHQDDEPGPLHEQSHQQAPSTRKRQRTLVPEGQQSATAPSPAASERTRAQEANEGWTADVYAQSPYSTRMHAGQQPDTQSPVVLDSTINAQALDQPPSKAKRLSTLHSRKYF